MEGETKTPAERIDADLMNDLLVVIVKALKLNEFDPKKIRLIINQPIKYFY